MRSLVMSIVVLVLALFVCPVRAEFPTPSAYPISWELAFEWATPRRIAVVVPNEKQPQAYWYMTYRVTNTTGTEQQFLPFFEMLTEDGRIIRSDKNVPDAVFAAIKERERSKYLEPPEKIAGTIRVGEDQAVDSVAVWLEPAREMGRFSIFASNLSGESVIMLKTDAGYVTVKKGEELVGLKDPELLVLRKTLQANYIILGDEVFPGEDEVNENPNEWIMR